MIVLGMQEAHDASAAIMVDGVVIAACQEERFTGLKGDYGYPAKSVEFCLKQAGVDGQDVDEVVLASHSWNPVLTKIKRNANFSVQDWIQEQHDFWRPTKYGGKVPNYYSLFKDRTDFSYDDSYPADHLLENYGDETEMKQLREIRLKTVAERVGVSLDKVRTVTHEDCHTYYAYFGSPIRGEALSLTAEGLGDYSNGTVGLFKESGRKELAHTYENHIGHIYLYTTLLLGMKPSQHEYKVMGMAAYANEYETAKCLKVFENILKVDGLNIVFDQKPSDLYFHFRDALEAHRFDGIAGALQKFTEDLLCEWVSNAIRETGNHKITFSGGVAQNIKADKKISEIDGVEDIFICPAAGDTSLPIGACYLATWEHLKKTGGDFDSLRPMDDVYLGPEFSRADTDKAIRESDAASRYEIVENATAGDVADLLVEGKVVARCCGRMEFGMRSLGNRSILADPRRADTIRKINDAIKFRDFWMPFTPSILHERMNDYIRNPKGLKAPFMTMAFDSTPLAQRDLPAALHPADQTARPQDLEKERNPGYYDVIKEFENKTGVGGVLNTSFNLHGDAIVLGPKEAIYTLDNSELDAVQINDVLVKRRAA